LPSVKNCCQVYKLEKSNLLKTCSQKQASVIDLYFRHLYFHFEKVRKKLQIWKAVFILSVLNKPSKRPKIFFSFSYIGKAKKVFPTL
jgi:hypothetical protein